MILIMDCRKVSRIFSASLLSTGCASSDSIAAFMSGQPPLNGGSVMYDSKNPKMARSFRPAVGSGFTTARIFSYMDSAMAANVSRSSSSLFLKWRYMAPFVKPVASVMSLTEVALLPRVLNGTAERCNILFLVYSGLRMNKDTNRYLPGKIKFRILKQEKGGI